MSDKPYAVALSRRQFLNVTITAESLEAAERIAKERYELGDYNNSGWLPCTPDSDEFSVDWVEEEKP